MQKSGRRILALTAALAVCMVISLQIQPILDWLVLRSYTPSPSIASFVERTAMTQKATRLLYVNKPVLDGRAAFNQHCPNGTEQSVVLGCYLGNRQGIFIYNVTDHQLDGVREVTTAHEMLHQAYDRLSRGERHRIDGLLQQQLTTITDETLKQQIEQYKKTEPDAINTELHSLLGTQTKTLSPELEGYYKQYFTDRSKVVGLYDAYRSAFTSRKLQIDAYDAQLKALKPAIESLQQSLERQLGSLDTTKSQMDRLRSAGDIAGFNSLVGPYNAKATAYNADLEVLKQKITEYNTIVNQRNAIADQEQALQQSLSSKSLPGTVE